MPHQNLPREALAKLDEVASDQILARDPRSPSYPSESSISFQRREAQFVPTIFAGYCDLMGFHRHLLDDSNRTSAFVNAVQRLVRAGDRVLDLGAGTGILSLAACRAGASLVYAVEHSAVLDIARNAVEQNGYSQQVRFIKSDSRHFQPPEPVDLIVSECIGLMGLGGTMVAALSDMLRRALKPSGRVIPQAIEIYVAPVQSSEAFHYVHCWREPRFGFDFSSLETLSSNNAYLFSPRQGDLIADPSRLAHIDFLKDLPDGTLSAKSSFRTRAHTAFHGFCGWFDVHLTPELVLRCGPGHPETIWRQTFLPLPKEILLEPNAQVNFELEIRHGVPSFPAVIDWKTHILQPSGAEYSFNQSTAQSFPLQVAKA